MQYTELLSKFKVLAGILKQPEETGREALLAGLDSIINEEIPEEYKKRAPGEYFELYADLRALYEQFRNFILFDKLIGKSVVALGGGFSCGKSSFLNAIDGENALPTDLTPSTAVPTFIVQGKTHRASAVNIFNAVVPIDLQDIRAISHGFGAVRDENRNIVSEAITLSHALNSVFLETPKQGYQNLAFVDTPGYSKPDPETALAKNDEAISRGQMNSSSHILFFVQAQSGALKAEDIRFIKTLREDIPKLFIIMKADVKEESALADIKACIKSQLSLSAIAYVDVLAFSCVKPSEYDAGQIRDVLADWNRDVHIPDFARNFKQFFLKSRAFYDSVITYQRRRLEGLNTSLTKMQNEDGETSEPLLILIKDARERIQVMKDANERLIQLKDKLFGELRRIGGRIGVDMPEPSEIDLLPEETTNTSAIFGDYMKSNRGETNTLDHIRQPFEGLADKVKRGDYGVPRREQIAALTQQFGRTETSAAIEDGVYFIRCKGTGWSLGTSRGKNGTPVQLYQDDRDIKQRWLLERQVGGAYKVKAMSSNRLMEVRNSSHDDGAEVAQWDDANIPTQQWHIREAGGGCYYFFNANSGKVLDARSDDGVSQQSGNGSDAQKFRLVRYTDKGVKSSEKTDGLAKYESLLSWFGGLI